MTEMVYQAEAQEIQVTTRFFIDDIAIALGEEDQYFDLSDSNDPIIQDRVGTYYEQHFGLSLDGQPVRLNFIGFELEDDLLYCYGEVKETPSFTRATASCSWLFDVYDSQVNILNLNRGDQVYGLHLNAAKGEQAFEL